MRGRDALDEAGFSLLEALVASTVLCVGVLALVQLFTIAIGSMTVAADQTNAALLAEQKVAEIRARRVPLAGQDVVDALGRPRDAIAAGDSQALYAREWSVAPLPPRPDAAQVVQVVVRRLHARDGSGIKIAAVLEVAP